MSTLGRADAMQVASGVSVPELSSGASRSVSRFHPGRRGRLVRRLLLATDLLGLILAFSVATFAFRGTEADVVSTWSEIAVFVVTLPLWLVVAQLLGLYEGDVERAGHSTADDVFGVISLVTIGTWGMLIAGWATGLASVQMGRLVCFWALGVASITAGRVLVRSAVRHHPHYSQNTLILGAGKIGQLVARKIQQHPEYGLRLVGLLDDDPRAARTDLGDVSVLGTPRELPELVETLGIERVIVAFSNDPDASTMAIVRELRERDLIVDVVPRLFELMGPRSGMHALEGLPLVYLPPIRISRLSLAVKRSLDLAAAAFLLLLTAPLFAYIAVRIKLDSDGPVLFRQTRLGLNMTQFTALKFRTMNVDTDERVHREYVRSIMSADATLDTGIYKLRRDDSVTRFGRWLRKTSLDELPQLLNVLKGDMSLVGPRPCIPYETENFEPHQFERFLVPQGITGLWQVTARASATFGEALEMDVAYVRGWSLGLDFRLLCRTPFALLRQRRSTA